MIDILKQAIAERQANDRLATERAEKDKRTILDAVKFIHENKTALGVGGHGGTNLGDDHRDSFWINDAGELLVSRSGYSRAVQWSDEEEVNRAMAVLYRFVVATINKQRTRRQTLMGREQAANKLDSMIG